MPIRVVLVDDEAMVRVGLRLILETEPGIEVVGEASNGIDAVSAADRLHPDVILIDVHMPVMDGLSATRQILATHPTVKIVILTTFNDDDYVREALRIGASGFLLKVAPPERLAEAVRVAHQGDALLDPLVTRSVIEAFADLCPPEPAGHEPPAVFDQLTARERVVLDMLARGLSNAEIAAALTLSDTTVKTHVAHILLKLQLRDRVQAVVFAYEHGLAHPGNRN